jgi:uncharacterized protein (TIGR02996 family)
MNDDEDFLRAVRASPRDRGLRYVYADWLEARGDERSEYLRLQGQLLDVAGQGISTKELQERYVALRLKLDPRWLEQVDFLPPKRRYSLLCLRGHRWDTCVCARCGTVSADQKCHAWGGGKCVRCGEMRSQCWFHWRASRLSVTPDVRDCATGDFLTAACRVCNQVCKDKVTELAGGYVFQLECTQCSASWEIWPSE